MAMIAATATAEDGSILISGMSAVQHRQIADLLLSFEQTFHLKGPNSENAGSSLKSALYHARQAKDLETRYERGVAPYQAKRWIQDQTATAERILQQGQAAFNQTLGQVLNLFDRLAETNTERNVIDPEVNQKRIHILTNLLNDNFVVTDSLDRLSAANQTTFWYLDEAERDKPCLKCLECLYSQLEALKEGVSSIRTVRQTHANYASDAEAMALQKTPRIQFGINALRRRHRLGQLTANIQDVNLALKRVL